MAGFRKGMLFLALVLVLLVTTSAAYAVPAGVKATPEPNEAYKEVGIESLQYLKDWGTDLVSSGGGYIGITCFTQAYQDVDYIMVRMYLQRWNGSSWVDLGNWLSEDYNTYMVDGLKNLQVARGHYYRVRGEHSLTHNGITEPDTPALSYSKSVYID